MGVLKRIIPFSLLLFLIIFLIIPHEGFKGDLDVFHVWRDIIYKNGIGNIYYYGSNYLPVYLYVLKLHGILFGPEVTDYIFNRHIKLFTLFIELIGIAIVLISISERRRILFHWALLALNISFLYNSVIWGQVDGIAGTLNFACIFLAYKRHWSLSFIVFVISINFKLQSIVFLPIILILLFEQRNLISTRQKIIAFLSVIITQIIILIPFLHFGKLLQLYNIVVNSVGFYPVASLHAANIWQLIFFNFDPHIISDANRYWSLSLKWWGMSLFFITSFIYFLPVLKRMYAGIKKNLMLKISFEQLMLICCLIPLTSFFFFTEMHERYAHNAWLFIAAWSFTTKKYFPLILFSVSYFLNMESVLKFFHSDTTIIIWDLRAISLLYGTLIIYLLYQMNIKKEPFFLSKA